MAAPPPPDDPPAAARPDGITTEVEGETIKPAGKRSPIKIKTNASASKPTSGPSTAASGGRREPLNFSLQSTVKKHIGNLPRKTSNPLKSLASSSNKPAVASTPPVAPIKTLQILGQARSRETSAAGEGGGGDGVVGEPAPTTNESESGPEPEASIAGVASSTPTVEVSGADVPSDAASRTTPPPLAIRKRSSTRSPRKTKTLSSHLTLATEPTEEDRTAAAELLKNDQSAVHAGPSASLALPAKPLVAAAKIDTPPSSTCSLPVPLPLESAHDRRSRTPPRRPSPIPAPRPALHMDQIPDHEGGLPYNQDDGEDSTEEGEYREPDRGQPEPSQRKWDHNQYERDDRRPRGDARRRDDDDRRRGDYGRRGGDPRGGYDRRSDERWHDDRRHHGRYDPRGYYDRYGQPYQSPGRDRGDDYRSERNRLSPRRPVRTDDDDEERRRAAKRRKRSPTPERKGTDQRKPDRPRSRTPLSDDDGPGRSRSRSPSNERRSVLSPNYKRQLELKMKEQSQSLNRKEGALDTNHSKHEARHDSARRSSPLRNEPPRSNLPLPPRPNVPLGGSIPLQPQAQDGRSVPPAPAPELVGPGRYGSQGVGGAHISPVVREPYHPRMLPSTINGPDPQQAANEYPSPSARYHALPPSLPLNGNGPPRPPYGSVAPPPPPPPPPTIGNGEYPVPPPAPYHAGNRPTDPSSDVKFDSPSTVVAQQARDTPVENDTARRAAEGVPYRGVRTLKGAAAELWVDPPTALAAVVEGEDARDGPEKDEGEHRFFGASHISEYTLQQKLGEGTFGVVYKGVRGQEGAVVTERERQEENDMWKRGLRVRKGDVVALKQIIFHNEGDGLPITSVREIRILKQLDHPNVVPVVDMAFDPGDPTKFEVGRTFMVFPYMDHDLAGLLENPQVQLDIGEIKQYGRQLLEGTAYLHRNGILHRDMKAANLLINNKGVLMIADFGLARSMNSEVGMDYTSCVVTRWYRPPELLLGERKYRYPVDMWGVGCILLEMFKRSPIFPGSSDLHQAQLIFASCGPPTEESMPGWHLLPGVEGIDRSQQQWKNGPRNIRADAARWDTEIFADLLDKILVLDPKRRLTASEALDHDWFWVEPFPTEPSRMREFMSSHEYDRRKIKENQQAAFGQVLPPPQPMIQPRPQPMAPMAQMGHNNGPPHGMPYQPPPVGAYNAPPPLPPQHFVGMGMQPSYAPGGGGGGNFPPQQGYGQGPMNGFAAANRPPPSIVHPHPYPHQQRQPPLHFGGPPPAGLDYGGGGGGPGRHVYPQPSGPSWNQNQAVNNQQPKGRVNLMDRLKRGN